MRNEWDCGFSLCRHPFHGAQNPQCRRQRLEVRTLIRGSFEDLGAESRSSWKSQTFVGLENVVTWDIYVWELMMSCSASS